jgi:hypothetical protein
MLRRLKRPGYIAVALIVLTIYFYGQYKKIELKRHREAILNTYKSYGEDILGNIKSRDLTTLQNRFEIDHKKSITLEDIATFISTFHLDRIGDARWRRIDNSDGNISMSGDLVVDKNITYPIDMMIVKRGDSLILKKMVINGEVLETKKIDFPLDRWFEKNSTEQDTILIEKCNPLDLNSRIHSPYEANFSK